MTKKGTGCKYSYLQSVFLSFCKKFKRSKQEFLRRMEKANKADCIAARR